MNAPPPPPPRTPHKQTNRSKLAVIIPPIDPWAPPTTTTAAANTSAHTRRHKRRRLNQWINETSSEGLWRGDQALHAMGEVLNSAHHDGGLDDDNQDDDDDELESFCSSLKPHESLNPDMDQAVEWIEVLSRKENVHKVIPDLNALVILNSPAVWFRQDRYRCPACVSYEHRSEENHGKIWPCATAPGSQRCVSCLVANLEPCELPAAPRMDSRGEEALGGGGGAAHRRRRWRQRQQQQQSKTGGATLRRSRRQYTGSLVDSSVDASSLCTSLDSDFTYNPERRVGDGWESGSDGVGSDASGSNRTSQGAEARAQARAASPSPSQESSSSDSEIILVVASPPPPNSSIPNIQRRATTSTAAAAAVFPTSPQTTPRITPPRKRVSVRGARRAPSGASSFSPSTQSFTSSSSSSSSSAAAVPSPPPPPRRVSTRSRPAAPLIPPSSPVRRSSTQRTRGVVQSPQLDSTRRAAAGSRPLPPPPQPPPPYGSNPRSTPIPTSQVTKARDGLKETFTELEEIADALKPTLGNLLSGIVARQREFERALGPL